MDWPYAIRRAADFCPGLSRESIKIRLAYSTFVNVERRYLYFEIPKSATTTMKHLLHSIEHMPPIEYFGGPGKEVRRDMFIHDRHNMKLPSLIDLDDAAQEAVLSSPDFMRFTVVRNPYQRLESAWQDKVRLCAPRFEQYTVAIKGALPTGSGPDSLVSFREFVDSLEGQNLALSDPHWRLQTAHTLHGALNFSHVGRLENLGATLEAFLAHIGEAAQPARRELNRRARTSAYDQELADRVYRLYRPDFDEYGYSPADWPRPEAEQAQVRMVSEAEFVDEIVERNLVIGHLYQERDELRRQLAATQARFGGDAAGDDPQRPDAAPMARAIDRRLGVIVPYRNRQAHLSRFLPHLVSYIRRECAASDQDVKIIVVEQNDDLPFNRGGLLNAGFLALADEVDYVCFHDVDYLPVWADYSYTDAPTRIIWWGMHSRPIRVADPSLRTEAPGAGLGAVTLFDVENFRRVNGYSNQFFGWGFEDKDLAARCRLHGLPIEQRDGTFIPLDHDNAGFNDDGSKSPVWLENERRYAEHQRAYEQHGVGHEGLSNFAGQMSPIEAVTVTGLDGADQAEILLLTVSFDAAGALKAPNAQTLALLSRPTVVSTASLAVTAPPVMAPTVVAPAKKVFAAVAQKICLSMIVKDEAPVIARCLASVRSLIDYWVIVDTGSSDGTQAAVRAAMEGVPGELHERPWVDFAHNRSEALALAKPHGAYTLIIDADDVLETPRGFRMPILTADSYEVEIRNKNRRYWRPQLVRNALPWRYEGVLHEFLSAGADHQGHRILPESRTQKRLPGVRIVMSEQGARRRTGRAERFRRDAAILEAALAKEADPFLRARYQFYLAQSHLDAGEAEKALVAYEARAELGFWDQEVFISLYRAANLKAELGREPEDVLASYRRAQATATNRAEALHGAARYCRERKRFEEGYGYARRALGMAPPPDGLFIEQWIYDYGVLDEYAVNAYWSDHYDECLKACRRILAGGAIPAAERPRIEANRNFAADKLRELRSADGGARSKSSRR